MKSFCNVCALLFSAILCACSKPEPKPMLLINFDKIPDTKVMAVYDNNGDAYFEDLIPDSAGTISFNPEFEADAIDAEIIVGNKYHGVRLEKGKSTTMNFANGYVTFEGDNVAASNFYNEYARAYNPMQYKLAPETTSFNYQSAIVRAAADHDAVAAKLADIKDAALTDYYKGLNENAYNLSTYIYMTIDEQINQTNHTAEKDSLIELVDPDDDAARVSGMLQYWFYHSPANESANRIINDVVSHCKDKILYVDSIVTNPANKRSLYYLIAQDYLIFGSSKEDMTAFINSMPQLDGESHLKESIFQAYEKEENCVTNGSPIPTDPTLIAPDGTKVKLSEALIPGKITYIDLWATWCVPCCREIPNMEKLAKEYAGNDQVQFISISCDDDHDAWRAKIAKDRPEWPQYVFEGATGNKFMDAMNANSIPRFFLIGRDGNFIDVDAPRPSTDQIRDAINQAISQ